MNAGRVRLADDLCVCVCVCAFNLIEFNLRHEGYVLIGVSLFVRRQDYA